MSTEAPTESERLQQERWELENSYGCGPWQDGQIRERVAAIDARIRELDAAAA